MRMSAGSTVGIVGLGLIGGSVARDLAARGVRVLGHDRDPGALHAAMRAGAVHAPLGERLECAGGADAIVLAVPVDAVPALLDDVAATAPAARLVTDVGSTKRSIVAAAEARGLGPRFVGSHPLAGDHRSGWHASRGGLFTGARVFLSPARDSSDDAMALARELWETLGARPEVMDASRHDTRLAWSSHMPHVVSAALALTLADAGIDRGELGTGGRDVTRLAGSSPELWSAIGCDNASAIADAIGAMETQLRCFREALLAREEGALRRRLAGARDWFGGGG